MRLLFIAIILFSVSVFAQTPAKQSFKQDVAVMHSSKQELPDGRINHITLVEDEPVAITEEGSFRFDGNTWKSFNYNAQDKKLKLPKLPKSAKNLNVSVEYNNGFAAAFDNGLYLYTSKAKGWQRALPNDLNYSWALRDVTTLVVDSEGRLWFGAEQGVGYLDGDSWTLFTGKEGLPYNNFTCATAGKDGIVWFGTEIGAIRVEDDFFYYRFSRRWLPNDYVTGIAVQENGTAWISTKKGVSQIIAEDMTLDKKADHFVKQVEERHNRMGFVCQSELTEQYNIETSQLAISDNDGMYTSMYGAAQAFKYGVTGSKEAKELANRSLKCCKWLSDITHEPGFPARVIIPVDWHEPVNEQYGHEYNMAKQKGDPFWKDINPRFPLSKDGKYRYKCDTSSDELAGHYFFYAVYHDIVAETEEEKKMVRDVVEAVTDHLVRHGYKLVDHDGKATRWGNFHPEYFNSVWGWEQRGLNSLVMLSMLNVAKHVTGGSKYDEPIKYLMEKHNYHINSMHPKEFFPADNVVPWDNNICLMSMYGLIKYEKDPELLLMYREALENAWLHISKQNNAFWDGLYGLLAEEFTELADKGVFDSKDIFPENHLYAPATKKEYYKSNLDNDFILKTLQRIPMDLIGYSMDNTHRLDVVFDPSPGQEETVGWRSDGYAVPVNERGHVRQDRDGFALLYSEGNGFSEHEGTFFLLPYYMALYHKLIK
jgi:hypothetical protein